MNCPAHVQSVLSARWPDVTCKLSPSANRFLLISQKDGKAKLLRVMEDETGTFLWPDHFNTVMWLSERDGAWMDNDMKQKRMLSWIDERNAQPEAQARKTLSEMVRREMAPRLQHYLRKTPGA